MLDRKFKEEFGFVKSGTPEWGIWNHMKERCNLSYTKGNYSKNKITMCDEWKNSFYQFYKDMGPRPSSKHQIERIDNLKGYHKDNCKWATQTEQSRNKTNYNRFYTVNGETLVAKQWARKFNIKYTTLLERMDTGGYSFEEAIDPNFGIKDKKYSVEGPMSLKDLCLSLNRKYKTILSRVYRGWDLSEALSIPTKNDINYSFSSVKNRTTK